MFDGNRKGWYRTAAVTAIAVIPLGALAACSSSGSSSTSASTSGATNASSLSAGPGFNGKTITVGALLPLSGPVADAGLPVLQGIQAVFDAYNAAGGVDGKYQIQLVTKDNQYDPSVTLQGYNQTVGNVAMYVDVLGTAPTDAVLPLANTGDVTLVPGSTDLSFWRQAAAVPVGAPYQMLSATATSWYIDKYGTGKKICTLDQNDSFGAAGAAGVQVAIKKLGGTDGITVSYPTGNPDFTAQITALKNAKCDAVDITSVPSDTSTALAAAAQMNYTPQWLMFYNSWSTPLSTGPLASYVKAHVVIASDLANWGDSSSPGMASLVSAVNKYEPKAVPSDDVVTGALEAKLVIAILEQAVKDGSLSRAAIRTAATQLGTTNFGGLTADATYGSVTTRTPPVAGHIDVPGGANPTGLQTLVQTVSPNAASSVPIG